MSKEDYELGYRDGIVAGEVDRSAITQEQQAEIERLRKALERTRPHIRNEIIEECARVAEDCLNEIRSKLAAHVGNAIRALKDKP